jgi:hypothetical protein
MAVLGASTEDVRMFAFGETVFRPLPLILPPPINTPGSQIRSKRQPEVPEWPKTGRKSRIAQVHQTQLRVVGSRLGCVSQHAPHAVVRVYGTQVTIIGALGRDPSARTRFATESKLQFCLFWFWPLTIDTSNTIDSIEYFWYRFGEVLMDPHGPDWTQSTTQWSHRHPQVPTHSILSGISFFGNKAYVCQS